MNNMTSISIPNYYFDLNNDYEAVGVRDINDEYTTIVSSEKYVSNFSVDMTYGYFPHLVSDHESENLGQAISTMSGSASLSVNTGNTTNGFNAQTMKYVNAINNQNDANIQKTAQFLNDKGYKQGDAYDSHKLRDYNTWSKSVKKLVIRDELMKIQIGGKTDLKLSDAQLNALKESLRGKDLSDFSDADINKLIEDILHPDEKEILQVFKNFKKTGVAGPELQQGKLDVLKKALENIDLDKITHDEFKKLVDNFYEKTEIHHRTSVSMDPTKQSDVNNLDALNTTSHDEKHTDPETGKINYKKPLSEDARDREAELRILNKKRVIRNEIRGIGAAALIGAGTGFAIGFIVGLAQTGINPGCLKNAFVSGARSGKDSTVMALGSYSLARTVGMKASEGLTAVIASKMGSTIAEQTMQNIETMCSMGVIGGLTIVAASVYQFTKLKLMGFSTKESLIRTGRSAGVSLAVLTLSIVAQGVWGGPAGVVVSVTIGVIMTGYNVNQIVNDRKIRERVAEYLIELSYPTPEELESIVTSAKGNNILHMA